APVPGGRWLRGTGRCAIRLDELEWRSSGPGGPGGQHANTSNTRAEVRFDVARSPSLTESQRARLLDRFGQAVRVVAADTRSQARNRELALSRLRERLAGGLPTPRARRATPPRPRRARAPPAAGRRRRLEAKRRRSDLKRQRRTRPGLED